jgi:hypothetical protein
VSFLHVWRPDVLLEDELFLVPVLARARVFADDGLRIGPLLVVVEEVLDTHRGDRTRVRGDIQTPDGNIDIVNAVVADVANTEVIPPAPGAMEEVVAILDHRRGPHPEVEVEMLRRLARLSATDAVPQLAVPHATDQDIADDPVVQLLHRLNDSVGAAALRADLDDALVPFLGLNHKTTLADIVRSVST